ncbi:MAG: tRNA pseudouridine(38-40) synthase TruA [Thermodesulfobacteriota bacterium]
MPDLHAEPCRRLKLTIAYDGSQFAGWQRQSNAPSLQGAIEQQLARMTGEGIVLHGAGRTDAGVHALAMTAHFSTASSLSCQVLQRGLNGLLPDAIRILQVDEVDHHFHARISAKAKIYQYFFVTAPLLLPHRRLYCAHFPGDFDVDRVRRCLPFLHGLRDFSSFEAAGSRDLDKRAGRGAVRRIFAATLAEVDAANREYLFEICGDGFLRKMVRNIVGTLIEVGQQRMTAVEFARLIEQRDRTLAGPTAPPCGLFLKQVFYEECWDPARILTTEAAMQAGRAAAGDGGDLASSELSTPRQSGVGNCQRAAQHEGE